MAAQTKTVEPNVVNGINVDDVFALIEAVKRNATNGRLADVPAVTNPTATKKLDPRY